MQRRILHEVHDSPAGGHFRADRTYLRTNDLYSWRRMWHDTQRYVAGCDLYHQTNHRSVCYTVGVTGTLPGSSIITHWSIYRYWIRYHELSLGFLYSIHLPDLFTYLSYLHYPTFVWMGPQQQSSQAQIRCVSSWISTGRNFSILNGYFLSTGKLIPGRRPNDYLFMLQWFILREMRCRRYQTTMASWDMQSHIGGMSLTNDHYIGVRSTEWTYWNQPWVQPHFLCQGK